MIKILCVFPSSFGEIFIFTKLELHLESLILGQKQLIEILEYI